MDLLGSSRWLSITLCGFLAATWSECLADDWLFTRTQSGREFWQPATIGISNSLSSDSYLPTIKRIAADIQWGASVDYRFSVSGERTYVIRAQNTDVREPSAIFDGGSQGSSGFSGDSTTQRDITTRSEAGAEHEAPGPIEVPGPDSADFPDSAFTVKPGVVYVETSLTTESSKGPRVRDYFTNTLIRVGLKEDWELRISSPGLIQEVGPGVDTTGFGPLTFGFKHHVWDEDEEGWLPALGIIAQVATPTASAGFDNGAAEPTVFFNFDKALPLDFDFEWNGGLTWAKEDDGDRFLQGNVLWAIGHEIAPHVEGFAHGFVNFPVSDGRGAEFVAGPGVAWIVSPRTMLDFSLNFGLTSDSPHRIVRFGLSLAF